MTELIVNVCTPAFCFLLLQNTNRSYSSMQLMSNVLQWTSRDSFQKIISIDVYNVGRQDVAAGCDIGDFAWNISPSEDPNNQGIIYFCV